MSLSFVDATVVEPSGSTSPITVGVPALAQVDDLLLLIGAYNNNSVAATPAGWNVWHADSTTALGLVVFWRKATSGDVAGGVTYSITNTASRACGAMLAYRGQDGTTPEDVASANNTGNGTQSFPSITPATAGAWVIAIGAHITAAGDASVTWSTSNMDAVDKQALGSTAGVTDPTLGVAHFAWTSGAFTPNLTSTGTTGRSISISSAIRPAATTTPSGGSSVDVSVTTAGTGIKVATGGSTVDVAVTETGGGHVVTAPSGGSSVDVTVSTSGTGSKRATGGSSVAVDASTSSAGHKESTGGSGVSVDVSVASGGLKSSSGGSSVDVAVTEAGSGEKIAAGGSSVDVTVTTSGSGTNPGGAPQGGSTVDVTVSTSGAGSKRATGGSTAAVGASTDGTGHKESSGGSDVSVSVSVASAGQKSSSGGSSVDVTVSEAGAGVKAGAGGSEATIVVSVTGGGSNPGDRDRDVLVAARVTQPSYRAATSSLSTYAVRVAPRDDRATVIHPSTATADFATVWRATVSTATRQIYAGTTEYLVVNVSANVDLGDQAVSISLDGATFIDAEWVGSTASPRRAARVLLNIGNTPAAGTHPVYVQLDDGVEVPIIFAGQVVVIDPTA